MTKQCAAAGCPELTDSGLCQSCRVEQSWGDSSDYDADGRRVNRDEGEPSDRDDEIATDGGRSSDNSTFHVGRVTHESIAADLMDYLRDNPGVCAEGNVVGWRWVRYTDGEWRATDYGGQDRRKYYVLGTVLEPDTVREWLTTKPVTLLPASEAHLWGPSETTVWEDAADQDVFTDRERCFYCGQSERTVALETYETTDDGDCALCSDCHEQWERAGEIVGPADREISCDGGTLRNADRPAWNPSPTDETRHQCLGCGEHVQPGTIRIYGTNEGRLYACTSCSTPRDLRQGAGSNPDYDPEHDRGQSTASGYHPIFGGDST